MEPTSEPENRQSRGLARFWPVHGMPTPTPRQSEEDPAAPGDTAAAHASDQPAGTAGPTGEHPQVSDQQSQPHDDQQEADVQSPNPFAPRPQPGLTGDTQMVALGSRRPTDTLLGTNGGRWGNQGGFPPVETNGHRNGDIGPRHGGAPLTNGQLPLTNGQPPVGNGPPPGPRPPFAQPGADPAATLGAPGEEPNPRSAFIPPSDEANPRSAFIPPSDEANPRSAFIPAGDDVGPGPRSPFAPAGTDSAADQRSPFAPAEEDSVVGPLYAPSPFAPHASGSASVPTASTGPQPAAEVAPTSPAPVPQQPVAPRQPAGPQQPSSSPPSSSQPSSPQPSSPHAGLQQGAARPAGATPLAAGSAPVPLPGRPVSGPPAVVPTVPKADPSAPTRLEPTGWATPGPRPGASGTAAVPVGAPGAGRRSRDDEDTGEQVVSRRSTSLDDVQEPAGRRTAQVETSAGPLRPGDVHDVSITFWTESASEQFRTEWHEVKAQFVDDPVAALTRAHDLLTEAVHELTESMLAERDELDPLRGTANPDTESMRMAMRGYREFLDRILAL